MGRPLPQQPDDFAILPSGWGNVRSAVDLLLGHFSQLARVQNSHRNGRHLAPIQRELAGELSAEVNSGGSSDLQESRPAGT